MDKQWLDQHVEAYVDGDLDRRAARALERACEDDPEVREWVASARRVKAQLRAVTSPQCPPEVTAPVLDRIRASAAARPARGRVADLGALLWRPGLALATVALLLVVLLERPSSAPPPITDEAVAEALLEVKWTLAYVNGVGSRTGQTIRQEVLQEGVIHPIERGLGLQTPSSAQ